MSFLIHYNNKSYSAALFAAEIFSSPFVKEVQSFVKKWIDQAPFTFYTSGSTGDPKAIVFEKWQLVASAQNTIQALGLNKQSNHILLCLNPKFVGGAMMIARAIELDCDLTLIDPGTDVLERLEPSHPFTFASFVPLQLLHTKFDYNTFNRFNLVLIGGTHINNVLENRLALSTPCCYHTYGMTETLSHIALRKIGVSNYFYPLGNSKLTINSAHCLRVKVDFLADWLDTHDEAELFENGSFIVKGRTDFVINSGARKIYPEQLEFVMEELIVEEKLNLGSFIVSWVPDSALGQKCVCVFNDIPDLKDYQKLLFRLIRRVDKYQIPKGIIAINEWPLLENGKINRKRIIELAHNQ